jgi:hypothetical protein
LSAKGRGEAIGGEYEVYPTPAWCVLRLLDRIGEELRPGLWLEPCAGYGAIIRACEQHRFTKGRLLWSACEIRSEVEALLAASLALTGSPGPIIGDYLAPGVYQSVLRECLAVVTNPPFSLAIAFLQKSMAIAPHAHQCLLLRTNFINGAEDRYEWLKEHMPDEYGIPDRPSFRVSSTGISSDSGEYSWFVWGPGAGTRIRRRGNKEMLDQTPLADRKRDLLESQSLLAGLEFKAPQLGLWGGAT